MIARASQLFLPTLREDPADAEAASHKLLVRGGIIRDEMDLMGSQEMYAPVLTPAELWRKTGRYRIPELFKLKDRSGRDFILPLSHEETFTFHATELQSYKQLPQLWYHMQTKDRSEE